MNKLFIVDAVNFLFRAYYAIGPMTNAKGESTGALFGFIRSIYKLINDFSPDYFIAVFDGPDNKKSRTDIYAQYKSHREKMPEDLFWQLEKALEFCQIAGIPYLSIPGVEADDTMGSIAKWMEKRDVKVFLCSGDKDLCQLVTDHIFVINPQKDNLLVDRKKVKELFNVYPEQMIDYLAIMGDASDNIPGLEGFGPKTASALLGEFGTLEEILDHPEKLSGKKKETVIAGREIALMSKKLATIHVNIDFPHDEKFFHLATPDMEKVKEFYQEMRFLSLLKELGPDTEVQESPRQQSHEKIEHQYHLVDDEQSLKELILRLEKEKEICVDTETTSVQPMLAEIVGIGLGCDGGKAWYIPCNGSLGKERVVEMLKPLLENPNIHWIGHNIKYDLHVFLNVGIALKKIGFDTILASYLISPQTQRHNLDELTLEKFSKVKIPIEDLIGKGKNQRTMATVPFEKIAEYCCEDVDYTLRLKRVFEKELEKLQLKDVYQLIELPLISILASMERNGIYVDLKKLEKMSEELKEKLNELEHKIYHHAGEKFNLNSPKQLSVILFEKMGIKPPKKTTTGFSTAADVLETLKDESPIVEELIEYRTLEKLRSTYVDALPNQINPSTSRIHCTFNQSVAATGRLSCQDPNLQNIPVKTQEGKKIRAAFRPEKSHHSFVSADYSQVELRLLAHLSEDPALLKAFRAGEDIHTFTASLVFGLPLAEVTSPMRNLAKTVNFGVLYGQGAFGLSKQLGISFQEADQFIKTYFERYGNVKEFLHFCKESVRKTGRAVTLTGRQRPIPEIHSKNPMIRAGAERLAINTPLQGTAADLIKMAMIQVDGHLQAHPTLGMMILQIHDELLFEVPDEHAQRLSKDVKKIMEGVFDLSVPLTVDISIGKNWGEC